MDKELKQKRLKIYFSNLLPIDTKLLKPLDLSKINTNIVQCYIYSVDIHKELFCQILLDIGKKIDDRPSYKVMTVSELCDHHFDNEKPSRAPYLQPQVLFILYTINGLENSYTGPILDKVVEDRRALNKKTFIFYKGQRQGLSNIRINSVDEVVDFNARKLNTKGSDIL